MITQLNKVELIGVVGSKRIQTIDGTKLAKFSMATNRAYKGRDGLPVIETTWHSITAWEGRNMPDFDNIKAGSNVKVVGRLRYQRYTDESGNDRTIIDIVASSVSLLEDAREPQED